MGDAPRLFLDVQAIQDERHWERGVARYVAMLATSLLRIPDLVACAALNPWLAWPAHAPTELLDYGLVWNTATEFRRASEDGPLAYVLMSPFHLDRPIEASLPSYALESTTPLVTVLYDLIPRIVSNQYLGDHTSARFYQSREQVLQHSDLVLAISQASADDAVRLLDIARERLAVIGAGASEFFYPAADRAVAQRELRAALPAITRPFVFALSFPDPRKNVETLIRGFARLPPALRAERQLVVAGRSSDAWLARLEREAARAGLRSDELVLLGLVPEVQLRLLYQSAELYVNPSRYEGFGLPVLEAARCDCPAIVADAASLPEILEWPRATFPTENDRALAALMSRALVDAAFRDELRAAAARAAQHHTWDNVAQRTAAAVRSESFVTLARRRAARRGAPPRVAYLGRTEPGLSGQPQARALVRALSRLATVEVFDPGSRASRDLARAQLPSDVFVAPLGAIGRTRVLSGFDLVVDGLGTVGLGLEEDVPEPAADSVRTVTAPRVVPSSEAPSTSVPSVPTLAVVEPATPVPDASVWLRDTLSNEDDHVLVIGLFDAELWRALRTAADALDAGRRLTVIEVVDDLEVSSWMRRAARVVDLTVTRARRDTVAWLAAAATRPLVRPLTTGVDSPGPSADRPVADETADMAAARLVAMATVVDP